MARKKVVLIIKYFYPIRRPSGISSFVYDLAEALAQKVDLTVVSYWQEKDNKAQYQHQGYTIYKAKRPFPLTASRLVNEIKPEVVIIFSGIYQPFKTMLYFGLISLLLTTKRQIFCQATNYQDEILPRYYSSFLNHFKAVVAPNNYLWQQYQNLGVNSQLIPPGVDLKALAQASITKVAKNKEVRIGFFGHFYHLKGPDRLLEAFIKINPKNADLIFAGGDGPLKKEIEEAAKKDNRIKIIDWQENIIPYLSSCDLVVFPYRSSVSVLGMAHAALQAMALGIPVIGTKTPSLEFLIKDGYNGYIINSDKELGEKLEFLINNFAKRKELGEKARQTILSGFDLKKITEDYLNLINGN